MLTILALAAASAVQADPSDRPTWATLRYGEALRRGEFVYDFGNSSERTPQTAWVRRTRIVDGVQTIDWADGKRCPASGE